MSGCRVERFMDGDVYFSSELCTYYDCVRRILKMLSDLTLPPPRSRCQSSIRIAVLRWHPHL